MRFLVCDGLDQLLRQHSRGVNSADYSAGAKFVDPPRYSGRRCSAFASYCLEFCVPWVHAVATQISSLITKAEAWHWSIAELPVLVAWIDQRLERVRGKVLHEGLNNAMDSTVQFSIHDMELHSLRMTFLSRKVPVKAVNADAPAPAPQGRRRPDQTFVGEMPPDIPKREGKQLCLHYISRKGCTSTDSTKCVSDTRVHFIPQSLPPRVRQFVVKYLRGLSEECKHL